MPIRRRFASVTAFVCVSALTAAQQPAQDQPQTFRSRITIVPVDVRVVDRDGKPVTDLKREDFIVTEDGVPQKVVHFSFQELTAAARPADDELPVRRPTTAAIAPQPHRIFLLVMGRGRQTGPGRNLEAALDFVKKRLLPQDRVALLAYNRSTDFTADHDKIIAVLDRYKQKHEGVEAKLRQRFSGLAAQYSDPREIPPSIQSDIDNIFRGPGAPGSRITTATDISDGRTIAADVRRDTEKIQHAAEAAERIASGLGTPFDQSIVDAAGLLDMPFDEYVEKSFDTNQDLGNLYAGIRYLRYLDGEKHLVFMTSSGLFLPRLENANSIAALANDARVTIDILHTGGVTGGSPMPPSSMLPPNGRAASMQILNSISSPRATFEQTFAVGSSRQIATLTGGQMAAFVPGERMFRKLDESTRAQYLLGYAPTNGNWNGAYRRISVRVNRPGVTVLYRHGYAAREEITPLDRRTYLTYSRIASAANRPQPIADLEVTISAARIVAEGAEQVLHVDLHLSPARVKFTQNQGKYIAAIEATYFVGGQRGELVGDVWRTIDFALTEENYQKFQREGVSWTQQVPLTGQPRHVKSVLYQYAADLVGSSVLEMPKAGKR
jgi:VWFA-related protein